jgi:hypothetical protein
MSFVQRQAAHCDQCSHEWMTAGTPTHCAKCKSRKWNQGGDSSATSTKPDNLGPIPPYYQVESTDYPGLERHKPNPDRQDILDQAIAIAPPGAIAVELRGGEYGEHLIERREIVIQALRDVCAGKRLSIPAEVGSMDKSRPAHDPTTCRVYKCGMCSK